MKLFQLSVILRLILELVPFCRPPPPPSIITVYRYLKTVVRCFFQKQAKSVIVTTSSKSSSKSDFKSNAVLYLETIFFSSLFILVT